MQTNTSDMQLGGINTQKNKPMAYFSRKLSKAQRSYADTKIRDNYYPW